MNVVTKNAVIQPPAVANMDSWALAKSEMTFPARTNSIRYSALVPQCLRAGGRLTVHHDLQDDGHHSDPQVPPPHNVQSVNLDQSAEKQAGGLSNLGYQYHERITNSCCDLVESSECKILWRCNILKEEGGRIWFICGSAVSLSFILRVHESIIRSRNIEHPMLRWQVQPMPRLRDGCRLTVVIVQNRKKAVPNSKVVLLL